MRGNTMNVPFQLYRFEELNNQLLYDIMALRAEVFVVEQESPYLDLDGIDQQCLHICFQEDGRLIAYARIVPPGIKFAESSIGRIVLAAAHRNRGLGRKLIQYGIEEIQKRYGATAIRIEAQHHLRDFYNSLGFVIVSDIYDWGGIPHVKMLRAA